MKIVLVIDQFDDANNGTTISARRFAQALKNHGNEVRVIATGKPADYKYAVRQMRFFPVVEHLITSQGMRLAIPNRHVFEKAAAWADVVHFMMPSPLGIMGLKHVEKLGIPHTAAFHCQLRTSPSPCTWATAGASTTLYTTASGIRSSTGSPTSTAPAI